MNSRLEQEIELGEYRVPAACRRAMNRGMKETRNMSDRDREELIVTKSVITDYIRLCNYACISVYAWLYAIGPI